MKRFPRYKGILFLNSVLRTEILTYLVRLSPGTRCRTTLPPSKEREIFFALTVDGKKTVYVIGFLPDTCAISGRLHFSPPSPPHHAPVGPGGGTRVVLASAQNRPPPPPPFIFRPAGRPVNAPSSYGGRDSERLAVTCERAGPRPCSNRAEPTKPADPRGGERRHRPGPTDTGAETDPIVEPCGTRTLARRPSTTFVCIHRYTTDP